MITNLLKSFNKIKMNGFMGLDVGKNLWKTFLGSNMQAKPLIFRPPAPPNSSKDYFYSLSVIDYFIGDFSSIVLEDGVEIKRIRNVSNIYGRTIFGSESLEQSELLVDINWNDINLQRSVGGRLFQAFDDSFFYPVIDFSDRRIPLISDFVLEIEDNDHEIGLVAMKDKASKIIYDVISSLRIMGGASIRAIGLASYINMTQFDPGPKFIPVNRNTNIYFNWPNGRLFHMRSDEIDEFKKIYKQISSVTTEHIHMAIRRMNQSSSRNNSADCIVDLVVGLEALLLPDDNAELLYRLALRCASLVGTSPDDRVEIFKKVKALYAIRSMLVHGGIKKISEIKQSSIFYDENIDRNIIEFSESLLANCCKKIIQRTQDARSKYKDTIVGIDLEMLRRS